MTRTDPSRRPDGPTWHLAPTVSTVPAALATRTAPDERGTEDGSSPAVTIGQRAAAAAPPVVVITIVVAWRLAVHGWGPGVAVLIGLGLLAAALAAAAPVAFRRALHRFGAVVARGVLAVLLTGVWVVAVALPSLFQRCLRIDPFTGPAVRRNSRWVDRARRDVQPRRRWAAEPALVPVAPQVRRRRRIGVGALALAGALVAGSIVVLVSNTHATSFGILSPAVDAKYLGPPFGEGTPAAFEDDEWFDQYRADLEWVWTVATAWDPLVMHRFRDVETSTVNVKDGARKTWQPPPTDGVEPLQVWFYGGSAAFGLGQRDDHTIASELARVAWEDGVALDVSNRGVPGWLHWQDANRFSWDVATYGPPDAVVFYDGFNEIWGEEDLEGVGDAVAPIDPYTIDYWSTLVEDARAPSPPDGGGRMLPTPALSPYVPGEDADLLMKRYDRSRIVSRDTAEANDLEPDWFWQPSRWSRPEIDAEPDSGDFGYWEDFYGQLVDRIDPEVHDLTDALDGSDAPHYYDDVHHDEDAARLIAEAMWADLKPKYTALADQANGGS